MNEDQVYQIESKFEDALIAVHYSRFEQAESIIADIENEIYWLRVEIGSISPIVKNLSDKLNELKSSIEGRK